MTFMAPGLPPGRRPNGLRARVGVCVALAATVGAAAVVVLTSPSSASAANVIGSCSVAGIAPQSDASLAAQVVAATNAYRTSLPNNSTADPNDMLPPLAVSATLSAASAYKSSHMAFNQYMIHDDPAESGAWSTPARTWQDRVLTCGYPVAITAGAGENIAFGQATVQSVMAAWIASPGHQANLVNPAWAVMGAGAAQSAGVWYWSQDFGTADSAPAQSTAVHLRQFSAHAKSHSVVLRWSTAFETNTAGFRVYREIHGQRSRINPRLIVSKGQNSGHAYSFVDRNVPKGKQVLRYWLQSVDLDATKMWYGPASAAR